jgi:hypothetical protein
MELSLSELQSGRPRRTLIALDLGEFSEKIISYIFIITRDILTEFTIFHCLEGNTTEKEAHEKINRIFLQTQHYLNKDVGSSVKIHITANNLVEELGLLHAKENFGTIVIGATNTPDSWQMGHNAQTILKNIPGNILTVPPGGDLTFPSNVSMLVEKVKKSAFTFLSTIHEFVSYYGIFLNFVLFARDKQALEEARKLIEEYQDFFDSAISFNFIVEQEQTHLNFLKYIEGIHCESAVMTWQEGTTAYESAIEHGVVCCSPRLPILYVKRTDAIQQNN